MFSKKNEQIEKAENCSEPLLLGKPFLYWVEIETRLLTIDVNDILPHYVMENIELKIKNRKLEKENEALSEALNKIIIGDTNGTNP